MFSSLAISQLQVKNLYIEKFCPSCESDQWRVDGIALFVSGISKACEASLSITALLPRLPCSEVASLEKVLALGFLCSVFGDE